MIKSGWREVKIGDVAYQINKSFNPKKEGEMPYIGLEHIEQQTLKIVSIGNSKETKSFKKKFSYGDILFGRMRPYFRKVVRPYFEGVCSGEIIVIRAKENNDTRFIFYMIADNDFINRVTKTSGGADRPRAKWEVISDLNVKIPEEIETQQKIATILSNYDNLIENNEKRIKILEQMAKLIYDEWFVKFKFPGHENVKMTDSRTEFGKIPEGWEIKRLSDAVDNIVLGGTPSRSKEEYWNGNIPWIKSGELNELRVIEGTESITELGLNKSATKIMPKRTVLIAITGAILISMSEIELCANQSVIGLYGSQKVSQEYLYLAQKEKIHQFISKMSGSAQQHVNKEIVSDSFILVPKKEIMEYFSENIKSVFDEITNLIFKNQNLRKTRDFLLPKLISGEVDVSELDINIREGEA